MGVDNTLSRLTTERQGLGRGPGPSAAGQPVSGRPRWKGQRGRQDQPSVGHQSAVVEGDVDAVGMNPPKRQVFVDSFYFEEPNRRGTHKKSTTPRRATTKKPKANRKKATPQPAAQPRKPKARVEPTPAEVEARQERQREYECRRAQTPEHKELKRRGTQERRDKAKLLEVWPESHWPGFALRQADVFQSYTV